MRNIVIHEEYDQGDLKPPALLREYLALTSEDVGSMLVASGELVDAVCPGCRTAESIPAFDRFGLSYVECATCRSLYVSPRPSDAALARYQRQSRARRFWHEELASATRRDRELRITNPRVEWIVDSTLEYLPGARVLADVNGSSRGMLGAVADGAKLTTVLQVDAAIQSVEADSRFRGVERSVLTGPLESPVDIVTLFEVADRTSDVETLFANVRASLRKDGLCFMTAVLGSGFDVQTLWDHSPSIFPPDRLNAFSVEGIEALAARHGFEILEFSTPGVLDVDIVASSHASGIALPRFFAYLFGRADENTRRNLQEFFQANRLSSYGRVLLRNR